MFAGFSAFMLSKMGLYHKNAGFPSVYAEFLGFSGHLGCHC